MASALDRAIDAHLQRALDAGGTEAAADLTALRNAAATARSGHIGRGASLVWWAVRFSPAGAATAMAQATRLRTKNQKRKRKNTN
jgi:hypothetical protein